MSDDATAGIDCGRAFLFLKTVARRDRSSRRWYVDGPARWLGSQFGISNQEAETLLEHLRCGQYGSLDESGSRFVLEDEAKIIARKTKIFFERREIKARCSAEASLVALDDPLKPIFLESCFEAVCDYYQLDREQALGTSRKQPLASRRQLMMYVMREHARSSFPTIASFFGRDHTTVMHACSVVSDRLKRDLSLANELAAILQRLEKG